MKEAQFFSLRRKKPLSNEDRAALKENVKELICEHFNIDLKKKQGADVLSRIFLYFLVKFSGEENGDLIRIKIREDKCLPSIKRYNPRPSFFSGLSRRVSFFSREPSHAYHQQHIIATKWAVGNSATREGILCALRNNFLTGISSDRITISFGLIETFGILNQKLLTRCFDDKFTQ